MFYYIQTHYCEKVLQAFFVENTIEPNYVFLCGENFRGPTQDVKI